MATYRKKPEEVEATQWFKNGDHPDDWDGADFGERLEGKVVRYFRHPDVPGDEVCERCKHTMHEHGWIDWSVTGQTVCPGDYVVTDTNGTYRVSRPAVFEKFYELVAADETSQFRERLLQRLAQKEAEMRENDSGAYQRYLDRLERILDVLDGEEE